MNRGLVCVTVRQHDGAEVRLGWLARSAIHKTLKEWEKGERIKRPAFYVCSNQMGAIIGVGRPYGRGWAGTVLS